MTAPQAIMDLVERFDRNVESYRSGQYNETQLRREFIDPFFKALGWDVDNEKGHAEAYKDVFHEDAVKVGGSTKAPDYSFRIGGTRKFFVEAKKPSVNLKDDISSAFQLRRYSWSAKLPLGVLTDFDELAVYDGRIQPSKTDKASVARVLYFTYNEYVDRWDEIASIFSKDEILKGSFDKYAESTKGKRGTSGVDNAFLQEIESWRDLLARNIALRNPDLKTRELNFSVQRTIDRIIFLRICEDRGIERYGRLQSLLEGARVYPGLCEFFRQADERYNAGLFHFGEDSDRLEPPDELTLSLEIDDKPLKEIIKSIYYPESPYEFSVLPPEILGQVYEQFLGKVISVSPGRRVNVDYKPEVRKAGGVYYTPSYIVEYIVDNTVGKLLEGQTPSSASELRVLDPACGSGSFLIGAYQKLLDWHRDWYVGKLVPLLQEGKTPASREVLALLPAGYTAPNKRRGKKKDANRDQPPDFPIFEARGGEWKLTTRERRRILLNNIYGVDIDSQAVEVTKLSLHLKVLEGENEETLTKQLKLFQERALPYPGRNIKCGNSLIGPDFYDGQTTLLDDEEIYRVNPFDWEAEFPEVMDRGGFDVVIGNPPYIRIQAMKQWAPVEVEFYKKHYEAARKGNYDIYVVFVEKGLNLLNERGLLGFILPNKFFNAQYGLSLRSLLSNGQNLRHIINFGHEQIFSGVTTYTCLLFLSKMSNKYFNYVIVNDLSEWREKGASVSGKIQADAVDPAQWNFIVGKGSNLFHRLSKMPIKLADVAERIFQGIIPGMDAVYSVKLIKSGKIAICYSRALSEEILIECEILRKIASGSQVKPYTIEDDRSRVIYPYQFEGDNCILIPPDVMKHDFPLAYNYFQRTRNLLDKRDHGSAKDSEWYRYIRTQNIGLQSSPKLAIPRLVHRLCAAFDNNAVFCLDNVDVGGVILKEKNRVGYIYLLGLLNSKLLNYYFKNNSVPFRGGFFSANRQYIENLPIRTIDFSDPQDVARHDKMVSLVERMLDLHKRLAETKTNHEKTLLQRQIEATDKQIDALVYDLYGLTEEEIRIVESDKSV